MATPYSPKVLEYDFRGVEVEGAGRMTLPMELRRIDQRRRGRRDNGLALVAAGCLLLSAILWAWWLAPW